MCWARVRGKKAEAGGVVTTPCASTWLATCAHVTELWLARELTRHMHVTRGYGDKRSFDEFSSHVRQLLTESCTRFLYTKSCFSLPDHVIQQSTEVSLSIKGGRTEDRRLDQILRPSSPNKLSSKYKLKHVQSCQFWSNNKLTFPVLPVLLHFFHPLVEKKAMHVKAEWDIFPVRTEGGY